MGRVLLDATDLQVDYPADEEGSHRASTACRFRALAGERTAIVGPKRIRQVDPALCSGGLRRPDRGQRASACPRRRRGAGGGDARPVASPGRRDRTAHRHGVPGPGAWVRRPNRPRRSAGTDGATRARGRRGGADTPPPDSDGVLARFGLGHLAGESPISVEPGRAARLSLAGLVLRPPAVLLLDEPTFGWTGAEPRQSFACRRTQRNGQAQLLATHDPRLLPACDRVVALDRGGSSSTASRRGSWPSHPIRLRDPGGAASCRPRLRDEPPARTPCAHPPRLPDPASRPWPD